MRTVPADLADRIRPCRFTARTWMLIPAALIALGCTPKYGMTVANSTRLFDGHVSSGYPNGAADGTEIDYHRHLGYDMIFVDFEAVFTIDIDGSNIVDVRMKYLYADAEEWACRTELRFDHEIFAADSVLDANTTIWRRGAAYRRRWSNFDLGLGLEFVNARQRIRSIDTGQSDVEDYMACDLFAVLAYQFPVNENLTVHIDAEFSFPLELMEDRSMEHRQLRLYAEKKVSPAFAVLFGYEARVDDMVDGAEDPPADNCLYQSGDGVFLGARWSF